MIYIIPIALSIRWMGLSTLNEMEPDYPWLSQIEAKYWIIEMHSYFNVVFPTFIIPLILFYLYYKYKLINILNITQCLLVFISELSLLIYWILIGDEGYLRVQNNENHKGSHEHLWIFPTVIWSSLFIQLILWYVQMKSLSLRVNYAMILLIQLLIIFNSSLCLVLGANSHMIIIYILIVLYFLTFIQSSQIIDKHLVVINNYEIYIGWLLYHYLFFVTGHRCNFSQISWKAAYIGAFDYNFTRAGILTFVHQISGQLFSFLIIPILIFSRVCTDKYNNDLKYMVSSIKYNLCKYIYISITLSTIFVLCSMCNCYMHRRHLLVWDIFAPKIIFDMVDILIIDILSAISVLLVSFILSNLTKKSLSKVV